MLKKNVCSNQIKSLLFCFLVAFSSPVLCSSDNKNGSSDAYDLRYREVLYYFYQHQYQKALAYLEAIKQETATGRLDREAEIVAGKLNLDYGLLDKAEGIFQHLLEKPGHPDIPDETWLELAKIYYAQDSIDKSAQALSQIKGALTEKQRADYELLNINLHIDQQQSLGGRIKANQDTLETWRYYIQYNQGTGLIRNNHINEGTKILDELGAVTTNEEQLSDEIKALKDKANNTLGYYYLDAHNANKAKTYFEKVWEGSWNIITYQLGFYRI